MRIFIFVQNDEKIMLDKCRRGLGCAGRNFYYTTESAICQEKNTKKNNLFIFPKGVDKSAKLWYNTYRKKEISEVIDYDVLC